MNGKHIPTCKNLIRRIAYIPCCALLIYNIMKLFRIQSLKKESLWYSFDGKFKDKLKDITGQEVPMPWEDFRQENNKLKLLSSVEDIKMLPNWFTKEQIEMLFNSGYSLFEYEVDKGIYLPKGEVLFDYNKVISCKEIQKEILNGYSFEYRLSVHGLA